MSVAGTEGAVFCTDCGTALKSDGVVQQVLTSVPAVNQDLTIVKKNENDEMKAVVMSPFLLGIGITRLILAILWGLVTLVQWAWGVGFFYVVSNSVSTIIQFILAVVLLGVGIVGLIGAKRWFHTVDEFVNRGYEAIRGNQYFAGLAVLFYGVQLLLFSVAIIMVLFLVLEIVMVVVCEIIARVIENKMPTAEITAELDAIEKQQEAAENKKRETKFYLNPSSS